MSEQSKNYQIVYDSYHSGRWNIDRVYNAVGRWITEAEYNEITGFVYPNKA